MSKINDEIWVEDTLLVSDWSFKYGVWHEKPETLYSTKYISESHHNEIVEGLKAEIKQSNQENSHNKHTMEWYRHEITELKAEIESLKSKAESKRKHWNTK